MREGSADSHEMECLLCGKPSSEATAMISAQNGILICDECVAECANALISDMMLRGTMETDSDGSTQPGDALRGLGSFAGAPGTSAGIAHGRGRHERRDGATAGVPSADTSRLLADEIVTTSDGLFALKDVLEAQNGSGADGAQGVSTAQDAVDADDGVPSPEEVLAALPTPRELYADLSEHVVGQEAAKRALSVAVYNHYKRILLDAGDDDVEIDKSNIMLIGPTGSGKTLLAQTLARTLNIPFAIADATTLTEAGYVGEDVENILLKLITAADYDIERAQIGIVYIDEIDKIARKAENLSITRDVSGEGVQQSLLKIVEGCEASVPPQGGRKHPEQELLHIDTKNILFILGGAFVGLPEIIGQRVGKKGLGFASEMPESKKQADAELLAQVLPEDLNKYGMIPEFVGRIPVICSLDELTEDDLVKILTEPKNALVKQYKKLFRLEGSDLSFDQDALQAIAHEAEERGTGARGLRAICERVLNGIMYDLPDTKGPTSVCIHASDVTGETFPTIQQTGGKQSDGSQETKAAS